MRSELFQLLGVNFPAYFVLLITGFIFAAIAVVVSTRREGRNPDILVDTALAMLLAGVVGARILHVLADGFFWDYVHLCTDPSKVDWKISNAACVDPRFGFNGIWDAAKGVCHPKEHDCWAWARFWAGGLTYYGGFIGATLAAIPLLKRDRFPFWRAADYAAFGIPLGLAFGRMGCLLAGCCFGSPTALPWAISFPGDSPASQAHADAHWIQSSYLPSLSVHPTQIYESAVSLVISMIAWFYVNPRKRYEGHVFVWFLVMYASARFMLEMIRRDARGGMLGLSTSQLIGLGLLATALLIHRIRKNSAFVRIESESH